MKKSFLIFNVSNGEFLTNSGSFIDGNPKVKNNSLDWISENNICRFVNEDEAEARIPLVIKENMVLMIIKIWENE